MKEFIVELYKPAFPEKGTKFRVFSAKNFNVDSLSPSLLQYWRVAADNKNEAIAKILPYVYRCPFSQIRGRNG